MEEEKKQNISITTIIITVFATIIIIVLAFLFYYFAVTPEPSESFAPKVEKNAPVKNKPPARAPAVLPKVETFSTDIINFVPPQNLPAEIKEGDCQISSLAEPYRPDAFKCAVGKTVYDPCFSTLITDVAYCKMNPIEAGNDFLIKLANPLPAPSVPKNIQDNWAWFVELKDGTFCSPYTGARPIVNGKVAFYGCKSDITGEQAVLMGDLKKGLIWKAEKATLIKSGLKWILKSSEETEVKTVWQ